MRALVLRRRYETSGATARRGQRKDLRFWPFGRLNRYLDFADSREVSNGGIPCQLLHRGLSLVLSVFQSEILNIHIVSSNIARHLVKEI